MGADYFSIEQGLSDRTVTGICQDAQGFIWVSTSNGLNRFDGYKFLPYDSRPRSRHKITNSQLENVMADRAGHLLVFSNKISYDVLDPRTGQLHKQLLDEKNGYYGGRVIERQADDGSIYSLSKGGLGSVLHVFDEKTGKFEKLCEDPHWLKPGVSYLDFFRAKDGTFWIFYQGDYGDLFMVNTDAKGRTLRTLTKADFSIPPGTAIKGVRLAEAANGDIWLSILSDGVYVLGADRKVFRPHPNLPKGDFLFSKDRKGNLLAYESLAYSKSGRAFLFLASGQRLDYSGIMENQPLVNIVFAHDFRNWLLLGSAEGLSWHWFRNSHFAKYLEIDLLKQPAGISIRGMTTDGLGHLLIGTERFGIYELDLRSNTLGRPSDRSPQLAMLDTLSYARTLHRQGDSVIWIPFQWGVIKYLPAKNQLHRYQLGALPDGTAFTADGDLWLATKERGLLVMNPATGEVSSYKNKDGSLPYEGLHPSYLIAARDGLFWVGTYSDGLVKIDVKNGTSQRFTANEGDPALLNSNAISCIYEAEDGLLWVGTVQGGLHVFDPTAGRVKAIYTQENGLGHNSIAGIQPDGKGNFWISTYGGLSFFDAKLKTFRNYSTADGLTSNEFNRHSFFHDTEAGRYYFGGMNGVNAFYEKDLFQPADGLALLVSEASFSGGEDSTVVLTDNLVNGMSITLPPNNRFLNLQLVINDYRNPAKHQFSYKIEGLDDDWNHLGSSRELRLNHLPAGTHILHLRGADSQGNWSSEGFYIQLIVKEFWYKRWWAWVLYAVLLAGAAYAFYRFHLRQKLVEREAQRLQDLDEFKNRFFTNITHEFRTPLTVILGNLEIEKLEIEKSKIHFSKLGASESSKISQFLNFLISKNTLTRRNAESLLRLINQILDLAKLESNTLKINYVQGDVLPYLRYISESLHSFANAQNVMLRVESKEAAIVMDYDPERLLQIVHNLLSNAIKFTPSGGRVDLRLTIDELRLVNPAAPIVNRQSSIVIQVIDTGAGIPPEDLPHIFDRFYQANNLEKAKAGGTGIGLSLTKELVKAMGGEISVESETGKGTTFTVRLPVTNKAVASEALNWSNAITSDKSLVTPFKKASPEVAEQPTILLIEDNPDVIEYLAACLNENYQLDFSYNGRAGIEKALETVPDLIVSDVMMPEKDGFEVCDTLKNDERTSHIPIVLLTAKADVESRIAGLKRGADAYLAKPFHREELLVTLQNLLELRRKLQVKYAELPVAPIIPVPSSLIPDPEDVFLEKIRAIVEKNLSDADFEMPQLERALAMSRSQIFRKVKALTGKSPSLFIRSIRLHRAKELLATSQMNVSEVAYETGFSSPVYFSNAYLEEFGVRPSEERAGK